MWRLCVALAALVGCRQVFGIDDTQLDVVDAAIDAHTCSTQGFPCNGNPKVFVCAIGCWVTCEAMVSHTQAQDACAAWGGDLASILSSADNACVHDNSTMAGSAAPTWIGFVQALASSPSEGWSWLGHANVPVIYTNWGPGEPNDNDGIENGEYQVAVMTAGGTWSDVRDTNMSGTNNYAFTCRR